MLYCENCRIEKHWKLPGTYPYHKQYVAECESCKTRQDCYDYPYIYVKSQETWSREDNLLDKRLQQEYHEKADGLIIPILNGSHAGAVDPERTAWLREANLRNPVTGEIDWYATYELRIRLQENFTKKEKRILL